MHIVAGLILIVVVVGAIMFISATHVLDPIIAPFSRGLGIRTATSTASNHSAVYGEVKITFVANGSGLDRTMLVSVSAIPKAGEGLLITGWTLKTDKGSYVIPKAQNIYSPSVPGVPPEDVYVKTGAVVNFYSGKNPQSGQSQAIRSGLNQWQIWLGTDFLSSPHGKITLLDEKGKVVDQYDY